jgi:hypothetical protein
MKNKVKNSETPYFSTSPVQDQFGQLIVAFGITKRERLAMEIFISMYANVFNIKNNVSNELINKCYETADKFLNFEEEGQKETSPKIIL